MLMTTQEILRQAKDARLALQRADTEKKNAALLAMAEALVANTEAILAANAEDMAAAKGHISDVMLDRLALSADRIRGMADGVRQVAALPDPVGKVLSAPMVSASTGWLFLWAWWPSSMRAAPMSPVMRRHWR